MLPQLRQRNARRFPLLPLIGPLRSRCHSSRSARPSPGRSPGKRRQVKPRPLCRRTRVVIQVDLPERESLAKRHGKSRRGRAWGGVSPGNRAHWPHGPAPATADPGRLGRRVAVGRSRRFFTVHGRLRTAIGVSNTEPAHYQLLRPTAPGGQVRASPSANRPLGAGAGVPLPISCSIVRHKSTRRAPLEPNKLHRYLTEVTSSHIRHSPGSATAMEYPADRNSLHTDTQ